MKQWRERVVAHVEHELSVDVRALALMRIAFGLLVIVDAFARMGDARVFYSDEGFLPRSDIALHSFWGFRLYLLSGAPAWTTALLAATVVVAFAFAIGWQTRVMNALTWMLLGSLHARNELVLQGGDTLLLNMLMWSLMLPLGARWSVDARRERSPDRVTGAACVALYLQMFLVYFVTGTLKTNYAHWWLGEGVQHALSADHLVTAFGRWLRPHTTLLALLTWATLALEIIGPFLLLLSPARSRMRLFLVVSFILFHAGIALTLELGLFSFVCMACWLFALPSWVFDRRQKEPTEGRASPRWVGILATALAGYLVFATIVRDRLKDTSVRHALLWPAHTLRFQLIWDLFIGPREDSGWNVLPAITPDGREIDLLRNGVPLSWEPPVDVAETFPNQRWRKLLVTFRKERSRVALGRYLAWLCTTEKVTEVRFVYMKHAPGEAFSTPEVIAQLRCE
ncbi:MAG TPA: HTTM domain-containing protein [Polyangiaceae bacterium]|nr:HTTM domain-containing protein [Polyangiaceae bacterium]